MGFFFRWRLPSPALWCKTAQIRTSQDGSWLLRAQDRAAHGYRSIAGEGGTLPVLIPLCRRCRAETPTSPLLMLQCSPHPSCQDTGEEILNISPPHHLSCEFYLQLEGSVLSFSFTPCLARFFFPLISHSFPWL